METKVTGSHAPTPNSMLLSNRVAANAPMRPNTETDRDQGHSLSDNKPKDVRLGRAQSHADPDFVGTLSHRVRHHAVNADRGENKCRASEDRQQESIETWSGQGARDVFVKDANAS